MNAVALATPSSAVETKWTVMTGTMKGSMRLMSSSTFTIGRSPDCEFVVINDPKCSRKQAQVQWTDQGCEIICLNEKNPLLVNGKEVARSPLVDNDVITVGETDLQFNLTAVPMEMPSRSYEVTLVQPPPASLELPKAPRSYPTRKNRPSRPSIAGNIPGRIYIYSGIVLLLVYLFTGNSAKKKAEVALRTEQQIQADIETANKLAEAALRLPIRRLDNSITSKQAQEHFVRGFRDYRKGQFERSVDSFQACLALDPSHVLCNRYSRLAQRRFNELIQYNVVLGRKYRDQNQFRACRAAFRNVMVMVKDASNPTYIEAKANYDACNALAEGRY